MVLEVGRIVKPHGLRGEVIVELFTNRQERLAKSAQLETSGGTLTVRRSTPHQHRWIVSFDGVDSREAAEQLRDVVLSAEPIDDPDALWIHQLIGSDVQHVDGRAIGTVTSVLANPAGDILELDNGVLVPLRFVVEHTPDLLRIDPPEGLLEVNE